tara:strand:- start:8639 stop:8821 length:183 start_codon:yes stop_codon:yes gene_type:complete
MITVTNTGESDMQLLQLVSTIAAAGIAGTVAYAVTSTIINRIRELEERVINIEKLFLEED